MEISMLSWNLSMAWSEEDQPLGSDFHTILDKIKADLLEIKKKKNGTGNGSPDINAAFTERVQLQIPIVHQHICISKAGFSV